MYTFQALADIPVKHDGFAIICFLAITILVMVLMNDAESFFVAFFLCCIPVGIAYGVSYHWTNQASQTFKNEQVFAEFAGFEAEGYKEKSGKSYVDRHYTYVVYTVNGNPVLLRAETGREYPKTAILYKN